jgi:hypothetical protein
MNERILELAKEHLRHEMYAAYGEIIEGDYYEFDPEELQKFAELIVRECADVVKYYYIRGGEPITPQHIKKHFGVEE